MLKSEDFILKVVAQLVRNFKEHNLLKCVFRKSSGFWIVKERDKISREEITVT